MATIRSTRRPQRTRHSSATTFVTSIIVLVIGGGLVVYFSSTRDGDNLTGGARQHRGDGRRRLPFAGLYARKPGLPPRVQDLIRKKQVVGDRIADIKSGKVTVEEVLHTFIDDTDNGNSPKIPLNDHKDNVIAVENGLDGDNAGVIAMDAFDVPPLASAKVADAPPMTLREISDTIMLFLHQLHQVCANNKRAFFWEIWQAYHDLAVKTLYPWDREYLRRMPERRTDDSIFLSLASYRDENCLNTIKGAYMMAKHPEKLFVGLVQQNCLTNCRSGVMKSLRMEDVPPDEDCHKIFCESPEGKPHCDAGRVRALHINEDESLGPYAARYFASKLWYGEQWYMQIDSHMFFAQDWDAASVDMLKNAPSKKPVISHYPPPHEFNLEQSRNRAAPRLCGPVFATSDLEAQIIRLEGSGVFDSVKMDIPRFAPFAAAGYFVAHSDFLREVPFDPFLPWIFMGEEIIMSSRLWTSGYDIFSPTFSVVSHIYVRRHKPKFWESVHRVFTPGLHNPLQMLILNRVKYQLGYPESSRDFIRPKSLFTAIEQYSMGTERPVEAYLQMVGLDLKAKKVIHVDWCETGQPPPGFEQHAHLYN